MKGTRRPEIVKIYLKIVKNQKCHKKSMQIPFKKSIKNPFPPVQWPGQGGISVSILTVLTPNIQEFLQKY